MSPWAPKKPCAHPLCPRFVESGASQSRCPEHLVLLRKSQDVSRPSPAARGYGASWKVLRLAILERDGYRCQIENCPEQASECDHITPKAAGGSDDPSNLRSVCRRHHLTLTARFRQKLSMRDRS